MELDSRPSIYFILPLFQNLVFRSFFPDRSNLSGACKTKSTSKLLPMTLELDSIFWKTHSLPANTVTPYSLSLPDDVRLPTFLFLKLLLSNFFNLIYVNTKNFLQFKIHSLTLFFFRF